MNSSALLSLSISLDFLYGNSGFCFGAGFLLYYKCVYLSFTLYGRFLVEISVFLLCGFVELVCGWYFFGGGAVDVDLGG